MKENENKGFRVVLPFLTIIIIIFLITILLSWRNISKLFVHLGLGPPIGIMAEQKELTYTIPYNNLTAGKVVGYWSFANDTSGNSNTTNTTPGVFRTFIVIYPEDIHDLHIENFGGGTITTISQGQQFNVVANITNNRSSSVTRAYISQLTDPDSKTTQLPLYNVMTVPQGTEEKNLNGFTAVKTGIYTVQVMVWSNLASKGGFPISSPESTILISS
jgi:hypothetical protein